ncbi:MAG: hypothetical protein BWX95_02291 [Bacteroidetes bacterium ADurb.Bin141]|nr:MAG: hypothetical protein BWX95_02291 [Bacteroidetes bacterium ADurb.Bin141]
MKSNKVLFLLMTILFSACFLGKVDKEKGIQFANQLLDDLKKEDYSRIDSYYAASFSENEPTEKKIEKFKRLREVMGPMKSYELLEAKEKHDSDTSLNQLILKYKVVCEKVTALQTFVIINDEGQLKIIFQNVQNFD